MGQKANASPVNILLRRGVEHLLLGQRNDPSVYLYPTIYGRPLDTGMRLGDPRKTSDGRLLGNKYTIQMIVDDEFLNAYAGDAYLRSAQGRMKKGQNPNYSPISGWVEEYSHYIDNATVAVNSVQGVQASAINLAAAVSRQELNMEKNAADHARNSDWAPKVVPAVKWDQVGAKPLEDLARTADAIGATKAIMSHGAFQLLRFHEDEHGQRDLSRLLSEVQTDALIKSKTGIKEYMVGSAWHKTAGGTYERLYDSVSTDGPWILLLAESKVQARDPMTGTFNVGICGAKTIIEQIPATPGAANTLYLRGGRFILESAPEILNRASVTTLGTAYKHQMLNRHAGALLHDLDSV